jgi:hypothetical protein
VFTLFALVSIFVSDVAEITLAFEDNGPLGRDMGAPRPENDFQQFWAILEAINLVICTSCMPIVSGDVLKLSQPAIIVLFAPMLMHLLQYILFLSLSYVNHVYKLAQRDWNFPCSLFSLAWCDTSSSTSIGSFASVVVPVSVSSSDQGFSFSDFFRCCLFWEAFCCPSTVFVIIETRVWKTPRVSDDYTTGLLFRLITFAGWNKN